MTGHVGPVIFTNERARDHLEEKDAVVTFRTRDRTTGETHVRYERTGTKQHDCTIQKLANVAGQELYDQLEKWHERAGFASGEEWADAIRDLHGEVPDEGYLFLVTRPTSRGESVTSNARRLDAEKKNGVYLLGIQKQNNALGGYVVQAPDDQTWVERIRVNGGHLGFKQYAEVECTDFEIDENTLRLVMGDGR